MKICETFPPCVEDPLKCGYAIDCSSFDDYENGEPTRFIAGIDCPYAKWNKIDRVKEIGHTDEPIETSKFPVYKPNCNLTTCRYNTDGKCENEEKRKEYVEVSRAVLCFDKNFIGVIENTGQEIFGTVEKHYIKGSDKGFIRTFDITGIIKPFGVTAKLRLATGEVIEVYKSDNCQRLIEM